MGRVGEVVEESGLDQSHGNVGRQPDKRTVVRVFPKIYRLRSNPGSQDIVDGAESFNDKRPLLLPKLPALERAYGLYARIRRTCNDARGPVVVRRHVAMR